MGFKHLSVLLALRLMLIMIFVAGAGALITTRGYPAATLLAFLIIASLAYELFLFISKTNREVSRFLDAAHYADYSQRFDLENLGAGFRELGETFTRIMQRFRDDRSQRERELHHLKALLEHVPVPLISIHSNEDITLWNNPARRLFGITHVTRLADLNQFGIEFFGQIRSIRPGEQRLATFHADEIDQQLKISASEITIASQTERLISLQNIQNELDGMQLSAWQDLVRVLTHEIMNSITPVTSLARTAANLVEEARSKLAAQTHIADVTEVTEVLQDAKDAVETVARRSDGLLNFVSSYRQLTRLPPPEKSNIALDALFEGVTKIATVNWLDNHLSLITHIEPSKLDVVADRQMVEQVLINLLRNAEQALTETDEARVILAAGLNKRGNITITVSDNGPGISADLASKIFIPFFTTRHEGSGVGLALSRQIMIAHGGAIYFANNEDRGARFTLVF